MDPLDILDISKRKWIFHAFIWINILHIVFCQRSDNTPPVMQVDRTWKLLTSDKVGSVVTRVKADDQERDPLIFGLEPLEHGINNKEPAPLPFIINNTTGVVYLNDSLEHRAGQNIFLYVTVSDGKLTAKNEVWVSIVNSSDTTQSLFPGGQGTRLRNPPFLPGFPGFNTRPNIPQLPPNLNNLYPTNINNQQPITNNVNKVNQSLDTSTRQTFTYIQNNKKINESENETKNVQENPLVPKFEYPPGTRPDKKDETNDNEILTNTIETGNGSALNTTESSAKPVPDLTSTLVPVISVCAIFLIVGVVALLFRKKICPTRSKKAKKVKMSKDPNGGIALRDTPRFAIRDWRLPRAFSNKYESQGGRGGNTQITSNILETKTPPDKWEFPRQNLKVFDVLGEGAFGQVWRCEATDIDGHIGHSTVAVKTLKENASEKERSDLISELQVMKMLEPHPNVVRLLACCTEKDPIYVIMEYISLGKLQAFLRASRAERHYGNVHAGSETLTSRDLTAFVYQVARGMDFLSSKGIIHRDLAARNILITEDHVCKVADFGFARDVIASHVYERKSEGRLPIRWMAPESLYDDIFSVKSDVWSFGVLMWEVVTLGSTPYPGLSAGEVMRKVRDGFRLEKPEHCRRELYNIMFYCWDKDPAQRPNFGELVTLLERLLMTETDYIELERFPDHSYYNVASLSGEKL